MGKSNGQLVRWIIWGTMLLGVTLGLYATFKTNNYRIGQAEGAIIEIEKKVEKIPVFESKLEQFSIEQQIVKSDVKEILRRLPKGD